MFGFENIDKQALFLLFLFLCVNLVISLSVQSLIGM